MTKQEMINEILSALEELSVETLEKLAKMVKPFVTRNKNCYTGIDENQAGKEQKK